MQKAWLIAGVLVGSSVAAFGQTSDAEAIARFSRSAATIFRGHCTSAEPVVVALPGGGQVAATRYSFSVDDPLKGVAKGGGIAFTQVGRVDGGPADLGRRVGLPFYTPGSEYVLFLLPVSRRGLTSPAGAGEAALAVVGDRAVWLAAGSLLRERGLSRPARAAAGSQGSLRYGDLRSAVLGARP